MSRRRGGRVGVLLCLLLGGCDDPDLEARLAAYEADVRAVLPGPAAAPPAAPDPVHLPRRRERRLEAPEHRIGGFDFLAIQGCPLAQVVGRRNSGLGRTMRPSRRLVYELELVEAADACIATLAPERAERIAAIVARKRDELPIHTWNAVWIGEEMEAYLTTAAHPLARTSSRDDAAALAGAAQVLARPIRRAEDGEDLERWLGRLRGAAPMGGLLLELERVRRTFERVAALLEPRSPKRCRDDEVRLRAIFERAYLPLQRRIADLDRLSLERMESLDRIFEASAAALATVPAAMLAYHGSHLDPDEPDGAWQRYRRALVRHTRAWEPTLRLCGLLPSEGAG